MSRLFAVVEIVAVLTAPMAIATSARANDDGRVAAGIAGGALGGLFLRGLARSTTTLCCRSTMAPCIMMLRPKMLLDTRARPIGMTISGLGGTQECGCATNWRVQTKAVAACVLGKTASGDAAAARPTWG